MKKEKTSVWDAAEHLETEDDMAAALVPKLVGGCSARPWLCLPRTCVLNVPSRTSRIKHMFASPANPMVMAREVKISP